MLLFSEISWLICNQFNNYSVKNIDIFKFNDFFRSDAQRLAKRKVQKQWEIDHCAFDHDHQEEAAQTGLGQHANNGRATFAMVSQTFKSSNKIIE